MTEPDAVGVARNGSYHIAYECFGDLADPVVLLVNGLGSQLLGFRSGFCARLVAAGFMAVRYDNRDVGHSTATERPAPSMRAARAAAAGAGPPIDAAYSVRDMAADGIAVLDAIGVDRAHAWGNSMGGMIVQTMAIEFADRLHSMTSVMSTTGDPSVGGATPEAAANLVRTRPDDLEGAVAVDVEEWRASAGAFFDEEEVTAYVRAQYARSDRRQGAAHQYAAVIGDGDRTERLAGVAVPAMVVHGAMDPLIAPSGGVATARAIPGAELVLVPTMGHDMAPELWDVFVDGLVRLAARTAAPARRPTPGRTAPRPR